MTKAQTDVTAAREAMDAAKRLLDNRQQLFKDGALAKKLVDEAEVATRRPRPPFDTAQQHLQALQSVGGKEQINTAAAQVEAAKGQYESAAGAGELRGDPQPDHRRRHRSAAVSRARWPPPARRC